MTAAARAADLAPADGAQAFRAALGRFATGVAFVTAAPEGQPLGLIVNSLVSVSLEPRLLAFCPARRSFTWSRMRRAGRLGVNVLRRRHESFALRATAPDADRFAGLEWELGRRGVPLVADALAACECEIVAEHAAGDHWMVVGRVDDVHLGPTGDPLVFFAGRFAALHDAAEPAGRCLAPRVGAGPAQRPGASECAAQ